MVHPRYGSQTPTFEVTGKYAYSDGRYAVDLFRGYGATFFPCQEHELELFLARDENGDFATLTICISKPRQNGKSYGARWYAVWAAVIEGKKVLFSAHHGRTVRKMFKAIREIVEGNPDIAKELKPKGQGVYKAAGSEGIYFANGGMIEFQTRTSSGARGETYDIIIVDEAQELTQGQVEVWARLRGRNAPAPSSSRCMTRSMQVARESGGLNGPWMNRRTFQTMMRCLKRPTAPIRLSDTASESASWSMRYRRPRMPLDSTANTSIGGARALPMLPSAPQNGRSALRRSRLRAA